MTKASHKKIGPGYLLFVYFGLFLFPLACGLLGPPVLKYLDITISTFVVVFFKVQSVFVLVLLAFFLGKEWQLQKSDNRSRWLLVLTGAICVIMTGFVIKLLL